MVQITIVDHNNHNIVMLRLRLQDNMSYIPPNNVDLSIPEVQMCLPKAPVESKLQVNFSIDQSAKAPL